MIYKVTAKRNGDLVEYDIKADNIKAALKEAHSEANRIFELEGMGNCANVSVKLDKKAGKAHGN